METTEVAAYYLKMRYGEAVQVEYVDMTDAENQARFAELVQVVGEQNLPYPLVAINGHLRLAGSAHFYRILSLVEEVFQADGAKQKV